MEQQLDYEHRLTAVEDRSLRNEDRIEKLEHQTDALNTIAAAVEVMANEQKHQTTAILDIKNDVTALDGKVETLEHKPAKLWDSAVEKVTLTILATIIGFILARLGIV